MNYLSSYKIIDVNSWMQSLFRECNQIFVWFCCKIMNSISRRHQKCFTFISGIIKLKFISTFKAKHFIIYKLNSTIIKSLSPSNYLINSLFSIELLRKKQQTICFKKLVLHFYEFTQLFFFNKTSLI